jgi:hypothetical protein
MGAAVLASLPADRFEPIAVQTGDLAWDRGQLRHLLPTVSDSRMLIKTSYVKPLTAAPTLRIGTTSTTGAMTDTKGECWQFYATGLQSDRRYTLSLVEAGGRSLCQPWDLSTFPAPGAARDHLRVLFFTCAGGPDSSDLKTGYLPTAVRNRLLRRGLSFSPDVAVANGDHVYWDLHARGGGRVAAERLASFPRSALVFGDNNETVLKVAAGPQIVPVYGTDFRSTPVFFLQDDHDYFDNDEGTDSIVTFPPPWFQLQLARATQRMYYPEFLPDAARPPGLPWSSSGDRGEGLSESFGTLRFGSLVEILLYDVRRTMTLAGPSAVFVDPEAERWLHARTAATDVTHVVHAPSNPPGWSAGKWGEWYPDVLGDDKRLTTATPKPYWQTGWLAQHDRLMQSISRRGRGIPFIVSGDLHAVGAATMLRSGSIDLRASPPVTVICGPIGTAPGGWPSAFRGTPPLPPAHLDLREEIKPIEQHGFLLADFFPDRIGLRFFKWDVKTQRPEEIDHLEPFHTLELHR